MTIIIAHEGPVVVAVVVGIILTITVTVGLWIWQSGGQESEYIRLQIDPIVEMREILFVIIIVVVVQKKWLVE